MELLAPAGNLNTALAAFDAGADAVYAGLKQFNARERGDNFTPEEAAKLTAFAHSRGRKVYFTFNTLVKDSEIPAAADALAELDWIHPDALIVQDAGVAAMIRKFFPDLRVHASTQMALHNSAGVEAAAEMGCSRVILEREITLEELGLIAAKSSVELEVFIHGALCCSLSGTCLLSSWISHGEASGNRGKCRQPCRGLYRDETGKTGFFLSTRDLCGIDLIPEFLKMGIASVKIEGRLRKADYVSAVVRAYRLAIDHPGDRGARAEAMEFLNTACSRERSLGFYTPESARNLIRSDAPGGVGQVRGRVVKSGRDSFEADLTASLHVGDNIRVQPEDGGDAAAAFTILDLSVGGKKVMKAPAGTRCAIGFRRDGVIPEGGIVYRIGMTHDTMEKRIGNLPAFRPELPLSLELDGKVFRAEIPGNTLELECPLAPSVKHPVEPETVKNAFATIGELAFRPSRIELRAGENLFLPGSVLKELRRKFREWADSAVDPEKLRMESGRKAEALKQYHAEMLFPGGEPPEGPEYTPPFFTGETELPELEASLRRKAREGIRILRAANLSHFVLGRSIPGLILKTAPPLPVTNAFAAEELHRLGAAAVHAHVELSEEEKRVLTRKSPVPVETFSGEPVLLATRAEVAARGTITARNGMKFRLERRNGFTCVLPAESPGGADADR